jgi:hypothetical protein
VETGGELIQTPGRDKLEAERTTKCKQESSATDCLKLVLAAVKVPNGRRTVIERGETVPPSSQKGNQFKYKGGSKTTQPKK